MKENTDDRSTAKRKSISLLYSKARSSSKLSLNSSVEKLYEKDFMFKKLDLCQKSKASFLRGNQGINNDSLRIQSLKMQLKNMKKQTQNQKLIPSDFSNKNIFSTQAFYNKRSSLEMNMNQI